MPNIKKVELSSRTITGLQIRTKNIDEMNPETQKIAPLWGKFYADIMPSIQEGTALYGVYHNYESDAMGEYDLLIGAEILEKEGELTSVYIKAGHYLVFSVKGELPQAIMDAWSKVWAYFEDPSIDERRAYETDFELYTSKTEAEIYIGVHYL